MKKSCKNDEESGRKKCKRLDAKYKKKKEQWLQTSLKAAEKCNREVRQEIK